MKRYLVASLAVALVSLSSFARADVKTPSVLSDSMVLQRGQAVPVWGWADAGEEVTVSFAGQEKTIKADDKGNWRVDLDKLEACAEPRDLKIKGNNELTIKDVLVGEVWICSGQSNMEWVVRSSLNAQEEIAAADHPLIRHIKIPHRPADSPQNDVPAKWEVCSPATVGNFTAVGYFFGRTLQEELDVPIGLIGSNWGGTRIEPWTPPVGFEQIKEQGFAQQILDTVAKRDAGELPTDKLSHQEPTRLYRGMIHPLVPFAVQGAIWYQGESNGGEGETYYYKKHALVKGWRHVWNDSDLAFYWVQLANFTDDKNTPEGGDGYARVRDAERQALDIPHSGMAVIIDIGETKDIHPKNKQDVGKRLAQWALKQDYGKDVVPSGPLYKSHQVEGNQIRIHFDHVGGGLIVGEKSGLEPVAEVADGKLQRFAIAGEDKKWVWADAKIDGKTVVVSSSEVAAPVAVRYAYSANPLGANLYNKEGLPASPFRTDNW
ncbi:MAG: sialate O-acetylesterase [Planctomycetales bacterium]|nr:sialate O-acetylesterase [Planctomycetales bacterium]